MKSLSVREAAEQLDVSVGLVYTLCAKKRIRHERHGLGRGTIKIPEDALEEYRRGATVAAVQPAPPPKPVLKAVELKHLRV